MAKRAVNKKEKKSAKKTVVKEDKPEMVTVKVQPKDPWQRLLHWIARGMGLLVLLFWTVFIVMSHGLTLVTLMEGIIVVSLAAVLLCAWRYEIAGGAIYAIIGILYMIISVFRFETIAIILVATPPIITGGLFIVEGLLKIKN